MEKIESRRNKMLINIRLSIMCLVFLLTASNGFAQVQTQAPVSNLEKAIIHQSLSRQYVEQKKWQLARDEAKLATELMPSEEINRDAWLLLAATEERLGNILEARDAYAKYLTLSQSADKKQAVAARLVEIEAKADRYQRFKWGSQSSGIILGYSPSFQSETAPQVSSDLSNVMEIGFRVAQLSFGYKKGVGKAGAFKAPLTAKSNSTYTNIAAGARHVIEELYFQYNIELTHQPDRQSLVWSIPIYVAGVSNVIKINPGATTEKIYQAWVYDLATGICADLYTKSFLSFNISALYHFGIPFGDMKNTDESLSITNTTGQTISGSTSGAEVRIGVKISFGATPPEEN